MLIDHTFDTAVFLGPSLPLGKAREILPAHYYPPIRHGDLYRLRASGIRKFVIIDGVFDLTTPVWHREILLLLREGCSIVGASSMGALRAVELKPYGMRGFGVVYDWYDSGVIEGDDEVALFHTDETMNFAALSQPLVNIRYNLQRAEDAGVLAANTHQVILKRIKQDYFGDRLPAALYRGIGDSDAEPLRLFFAKHWIDLKARDASDVLQAVAGGLLDQPVPTTVDWFTRQTWNSAESSMPVTYGACLVGNRMQPHMPILETLSSRREEYEQEYHHAVQTFFLTQYVLANKSANRSKQDVVQPTASTPDMLTLARNGLTLYDWHQHQTLQAQIQDELQQIEKNSPALIADLSTSRANQQPAAAATIAIGRWARDQGYPAEAKLPGALNDAETLQAHCRWVLEKGPVQLGFNWDPVVAVFQQLQLNDRISELLPC